LFIQEKKTRKIFSDTSEINISHFLLHFYLSIAFTFTLENFEKEKQCWKKSVLKKNCEGVKMASFTRNSN